MAAIVTVYIDHGRGPEPERLLGELSRWAESAYGVEARRAGDVLDLKFADAGAVAAHRYVDDVLTAANPAWNEHLGLEAVPA